MNKFDIKCLVSSSETNGTVSVFEEVVPANGGPPLHTHESQFELFHVISGEIQFEVDGQRINVAAGGTAVVPPGKPHAFVNKSGGDSVIHFELLPSGNSEQFFDKLVRGDFENVPKFFADHGLKLLGPPID